MQHICVYLAYEHSFEMLQLKRDYELTPVSLHFRVNLFQIIEKVNRVLMAFVWEKKEKEIGISLLKYSEISSSKFRTADSSCLEKDNFSFAQVHCKINFTWLKSLFARSRLRIQ
jgi:hypothetical protein